VEMRLRQRKDKRRQDNFLLKKKKRKYDAGNTGVKEMD